MYDFYGRISTPLLCADMGCSWSTNSTIQPLTREDVNGEEDETGSKLDGRGDSAVSKGTADSGVVMEDRQTTLLPGEVPRKLPPLTSVRESEVDRVTQDGIHPQSSEILEELQKQGIIPVGQRGSTAGEAYSIMLNTGEEVRRRPPARLESLKAKKEQSVPSREKFEEKMRLVEERRKLREDELKTHLRAKSACVRVPISTINTEEQEGEEEEKEEKKEEEEEDTAFVEHIQHSVATTPFSQIVREEAEGEEHARGRVGDCKDCGDRGEEGEDGGQEAGSQDGDVAEEEEELTQVVELMTQLEYDSRSQCAEDKDMF